MIFRDKVIDLIRNKATSLPTLPVIINNIIVMVKDERTTAGDLAGFISNDQALSARVLKIANSPYYGLPKKIDSITRAVTVIGFREIISIALGSWVYKTISPKKGERLIDMNELWKHSIGVGFAAQRIKLKMNGSSEESTMLVGLLHDIGKILFHIHFSEDYAGVLARHHAEGIPLHAVESDLLGIDHPEMAFLLMKHWNFPDSISMPIRYHHNPTDCPAEYQNDSMIVNAADYLCYSAEVSSAAGLPPEKPCEVMSRLGITDTQADELSESLRTSRGRMNSFLEALL